MLTSLVLENIRSFSSQVELEIKPITILLGRNSSGKSTVTRLLPLYQQTFEQRTSAPILWNGDLVDFGSIDEVRPRQSTGKDIGLGFSIIPDSDKYFSRQYWQNGGTRIVYDRKPIFYKATLTSAGSDEYKKTRLSSLQIKINGDDLVLRFKENGSVEACTINGENLTEDYVRNEPNFDLQSFFPALRSKRPAEVLQVSTWGPVPFDSLAEARAQIIHDFSHGHTSTQTKREAALALPYTSKSEFAATIIKRNIGPSSFQQLVQARINWSPVVEKLRHLTLLSAIPFLVATVGQAAIAEFASSSYIGPMRAAGERYYRWQELAVDRVDPKGENFAMYVMSLSPNQLVRFSNILEETFGYALRADRESGHARLMLAETGTDRWFNLADVGFGFSQILPVIAQIHASSYSRPNRQRARVAMEFGASAPVIAIEQPELHLHPAFQAKIADLFISSSMANSDVDVRTGARPRKFLVETHSEALVNRLSELVAMGKVSQEDIAIYIFDKKDAQNETTVTKATIDSSGEIKNWPFGFFHY